MWRALGQHWSSYAAYVLSFAIIGIMWANHHNIFRYIGRSNHVLVMLNVASGRASRSTRSSRCSSSSPTGPGRNLECLAHRPSKEPL
ncbi:MAG: TMEM175 family protein [Gemmatimonadales bacterium]